MVNLASLEINREEARKMDDFPEIFVFKIELFKKKNLSQPKGYSVRLCVVTDESTQFTRSKWGSWTNFERRESHRVAHWSLFSRLPHSAARSEPICYSISRIAFQRNCRPLVLRTSLDTHYIYMHLLIFIFINASDESVFQFSFKNRFRPIDRIFKSMAVCHCALLEFP